MSGGLIEDRLAATLRVGAFDGDEFETAVAQGQVREAIKELRQLREEVLAARGRAAEALSREGAAWRRAAALRAALQRLVSVADGLMGDTDPDWPDDEEPPEDVAAMQQAMAALEADPPPNPVGRVGTACGSPHARSPRPRRRAEMKMRTALWLRSWVSLAEGIAGIISLGWWQPPWLLRAEGWFLDTAEKERW